MNAMAIEIELFFLESSSSNFCMRIDYASKGDMSVPIDVEVNIYISRFME